MYFKKILLATVLIGLVIAAYFAYFVYTAMFVENTAFNNNEACIYISSNSTYDEVRRDLKPLLKNLKKFDALAARKKYTSNVKAGKYCIQKGMTNNDIINSIRSKNIPVNLSFNNQNSIEQLAGRAAQQIEADSSSIVEALNDSIFIRKNGFTKATILGMFLPNSYEFFWNSSAVNFRDRMLKEYNSFWNENRRAKAKAMNLSPNEIITLASIVHEETKQKSEQARVAGVYMNRLQDNWPLQADPTLKYAAYQLKAYENTVIKRVLNIHKEINSPYNTYKNPGLPPGLIAMADISAIEAVLNYEQHDFYFFAADPEKPGFHRFAKTLSKHNQNARAYQRYLSQQGIKK
jgi:UPF0755 protein